MRSMLEDGGTLRPNARTLWEIQEKAMHVPVETASNLYQEICARAQNGLRIGEERRAAVQNGETLKEYQNEVRRLFLSCIGGLPPENMSVPARVTEKEEHGFFSLEKVLLEPQKGRYATAAVYTPRAAGERKRLPAVLLLIGHTDLGKADREYQYVAQLLAFSGFVVLALDPFGEGERFEHYENGIGLQPIQGCSGEHDLMDWKCKLLGVSLARYFIQDGIAGLNYLASRPDVDETRIGLTGHSGGGTQVCMMMLAAGERFACAAPCAYVTDTKAMLEYGVDPDNEMIWPGSAAQGIDYVDLLAGMAPKPLLILAAENDFFPLEGTKRTLRAARRLWKNCGSKEEPQLFMAPHAHAYSPALAHAAARFFLRHLYGNEKDLSRFAFSPLSPQTLSCTRDSMLLKEYPDMRTLQDELNDLLRQKTAHGNGDCVEEWLGAAIHADRIDPGPFRVYGEGICGHYAWRTVLWRSGEGHWNNGVFLRDMRQNEPQMPTVIALWPEGLARLAEHSAWIHSVCRRGWQVFAMDTAGEGSLLPGPLGSGPMYIGWGTMYKLSAYLIQLGDSLCAVRTRDIISACRLMRNWPETDAGRLCLFARGEGSRCAEFAALMLDIPVCADPTVQPYEDIVADKYHDQTHTHAWVFPGILARTDTQSIRKRLRQRGLAIRDPAGESFPNETIQKE